MWKKSKEFRRHERALEHRGIIAFPDMAATVGEAGKGGLRIMLCVDDDEEIIQEAKFQPLDISEIIPSASVFIEAILGKTLLDASLITDEMIFKKVKGLPEQKKKKPLQIREAFLKAVEIYRSQKEDFADSEDSFEFGSAVCTCFGISAATIRKMIREKNLTTIAQITAACKAGGGCESCHGDLSQMLHEWEKIKSLKQGGVKNETDLSGQ